MRFALLVGGLIVLSPVAALADDWPQFRGPSSAGVAASAPLPSEWDKDKNVQWKIKVPGVAWSQPIVWGDKVFVTTAVTENQRKPSGGYGGGFAGGPGGRAPGGRFGMPQPGQILPSMFQDMLQLSAEQKKDIDAVQKEVDAVLDKTLSDDQKKQFKEGGGRTPGGPGGRPGGFGGFVMPTPGVIMTSAIYERLKLSDDQKKQIENAQKVVDAKLEKILTEGQSKQLKELRERRGPGAGPGGAGRPGGFGGARPPDQLYKWEIHCLDRKTGKTLWKQTALEAKPKIATHDSNTFATETPVADGERVYAYFGMHGLFCYDLDGKLIWKKDLGSFPMMMGWGTAASPVLHGEHLFVQIDNEQKSFLVALDRKTGDEKWRVNRDEKTTWGSPIVWKNKVRTELVAPGSQKVRSYDPETGKLLWELSVGGGQCSSTPVGDDERLYVGVGRRMGGFGGGAPGGRPGGPGGGGMGAGNGDLFAVKAGASGDITPKDGAKSSDGVAWVVPKAGPPMASPVVYQGYVYVLEQQGGMVNCYEAATGKAAYTKERIPNARAFWASPWAGDGKIFCLDDGGTTHVLQAGPEFKVLSKSTVGEMCWSSPAIAGSTLILRSVDHLYCIAK